MNMDKSAVFYMLPTRVWELLIGSLLAIATLPRIQNIAVLNVISELGLLMMVYSIFAFTRETPFPGGDICVVLDDDVALYRDDTHLSTFGSKDVSVAFDHLFSEGH